MYNMYQEMFFSFITGGKLFLQSNLYETQHLNLRKMKHLRLAVSTHRAPSFILKHDMMFRLRQVLVIGTFYSLDQ